LSFDVQKLDFLVKSVAYGGLYSVVTLSVIAVYPYVYKVRG